MQGVVHPQPPNLLLHFISHKNYSLTIPAEVSKQGFPYHSTDCLRNILEIYLREKKSKSPHTFDWDFEFLTTLKPSQMFSTPSTLPLLPRDTVASFSQLVRDIIPAVIKKKPGALQALLLLPRLVAPNNLNGHIKTSKVLEYISLFRACQFQRLWEKPCLTLRYGSFTSKRCDKLARISNLGGALKALTSNGVLNASECYEILQSLHPEGPELDLPQAPPSSSDHFSLNARVLQVSYPQIRLEKSSRLTGVENGLHQSPRRGCRKGSVRLLLPTRPGSFPHP